MFDFTGYCVRETDKAYGVVAHLFDQILWLPKSKCENFQDTGKSVKYGCYMGYSIKVDIDGTFAEKVGLV